MSGRPAKGENESSARAWVASPILAWGVRTIVFLIPIVASWIMIRGVSGILYRPDGVMGLILWVLQAGIVGMATSLLTERVARHGLPLAAILNMSLVFPDQSPSRFGVALRTGTLRQQQNRLTELQDTGLGSDTSSAAQSAIEMVTALGRHDRLTRGHTERVRAYAELIAQEMGMPDEDRQKLAWGSMLHDIGKITVDPAILNKPGRPDKDEWASLQSHPAAGLKILEPLRGWLGDWLLAASEHHEKWDGTGYPNGLAGNEISLAGRITCVADAYDVITSRRSYKSPASAADARKELVRCSGTQFDPEVVRAFLRISTQRRMSVGPLAWLAELPGISSTITAVPSTIATSSMVAGSVAIGAVAVPQIPELLPFTETSSIVQTQGPADAELVLDLADDDLEATTTTEPNLDDAVTTTETSQPAESTTTTVPETTTVPDTTTTTTEAPTTTVPATTTTAAPTTTTTAAPTTTTVAPPTTPAPTTTLPPYASGNSGGFATNDYSSLEDGKEKKVKVLRNDAKGGSKFVQSTLEIVVPPQHAFEYETHKDHIHYESVSGYEGSDQLTYRICRTDGVCAFATVYFTVEDD